MYKNSPLGLPSLLLCLHADYQCRNFVNLILRIQHGAVSTHLLTDKQSTKVGEKKHHKQIQTFLKSTKLAQQLSLHTLKSKLNQMGEPQNLWVPPKLDVSVDRYAAFKAWKIRWQDYAIITELSQKPDAYQCAMLRYTFTEETQKIYDSLNISSTKVNEIIEALETFAKGIINESLERHAFDDIFSNRLNCGHNLRSVTNNNLTVPIKRTSTYGINSITYQCILSWNTLPNEIKTKPIYSHSRSAFSKAVSQHLHDKYK